jgi:hypothetical protein
VRVHVGDPELVVPLLAYFEEQADCVAVQVGEAEIEVSLLGSYRSEMHDATVERLLRDFRLRRGSPTRLAAAKPHANGKA